MSRNATTSMALGRDHKERRSLPSYAARQIAYHRAHDQTLDAIVKALPVQPGSKLLDLATGDGTYAMLFAQRGASVIALDKNKDYLAFARDRVDHLGLSISFRHGDAFALPIEKDAMDGAFCAQSLYDLQDVSGVLDEMRRVVRPGGWVAVMENDSFHHVVLPWPPELEVKIRAAQLEGLSEAPGGEERFYIGRRLSEIFESRHWRGVQERSFSTQLTAPLSRDEWFFLQRKLESLLGLVLPHLQAEDAKQLESLCTPGSEQYMLCQPTFSATVLDLLVWAHVAD